MPDLWDEKRKETDSVKLTKVSLLFLDHLSWVTSDKKNDEPTS